MAVTPAKAGVQAVCKFLKGLDSGVRRNDGRRRTRGRQTGMNSAECYRTASRQISYGGGKWPRRQDGNRSKIIREHGAIPARGGGHAFFQRSTDAGLDRRIPDKGPRHPREYARACDNKRQDARAGLCPQRRGRGNSFLPSPASYFLTRAAIPVDGGYSKRRMTWGDDIRERLLFADDLATTAMAIMPLEFPERCKRPSSRKSPFGPSFQALLP